MDDEEEAAETADDVEEASKKGEYNIERLTLSSAVKFEEFKYSREQNESDAASL